MTEHYIVAVKPGVVPPGSDAPYAVEVHVGTKAYIDEVLDQFGGDACLENDHTRRIAGQHFAGMEGNIFLFGAKDGIQMTQDDGVHFLEKAPLPEPARRPRHRNK